jgi:nucleoid-associated protein YgaU
VHVVKDGDTLQSVAHHTYGDPNSWRMIAEANEIDNPFHLRRGTALSLPRVD